MISIELVLYQSIFRKMDSKPQIKNNAVNVPSLKKEDLQLFIDIANECLQKPSIEYMEVGKEKKYDWISILEDACSLCGDYPDEESEEHAINNIQPCFHDLHQTILKLSHDDLKQCITDMEKFFT